MSKKPSVAFAEPKSPFFNVYTAFSQPLLGPVYMATQLKQKGYDAVVYHENIAGLTMARMKERDVLVISPLTSTAPRGYELAQEYKAVNPKGRVVMGGVHVSAIPYEAAAFDFVDNVGIGEGDLIIEGLVNGDYREKIVRGRPVEDLDDLPFPDFSLVAGLKLRVTGIETSRGCPHGCPYCYVTPMYGTKVRWKSVPRVIEEIRREQAGRVFFYDDNFLAKRSRSLELLDEMVSRNITPGWTAQARRETGTDRELAGLMKKANCRNVCVGYESVDAERLNDLGKGETVSFEESLYGFHTAGLRVHGMFMLDKRTDYSMLEKLGLDFLQVTITTPVPGTKLFEKTLENELFIDELNPVKDGDSWRNWKYFDGGHIVTKDPCGEGRVLSPEELASEQERFISAFRNFYTFRKAFAKNRTLNERQILKNLFFWYVALRGEREQRTFVSKLRNLGRTTRKLILS